MTEWQTGEPPKYTDLLLYVTYPNEIMVKPRMMVGSLDNTGRWLSCSIRVSGTVTHWMPLPKPPKEGGEQ